jgi:hypothetical protein
MSIAKEMMMLRDVSAVTAAFLVRQRTPSMNT